MTITVTSRGGVAVRLTDERWAHIVEAHSELAGMRHKVLEAVSQADTVFAGGGGELFAVRALTAGKALVVVYREESPDGFIITAFLTRQLKKLERRQQIWP